MQQTQCCVVGGGPAGLVLSYFLARMGVHVTLLEGQQSFDRRFRGDALNPAVLEILDELGLADRLLELPHSKIQSLVLRVGRRVLKVSRYDRLKTRFPYVTVLPQVAFLEFLAAEAAKFPTFRVEMGARVESLIVEEGVVRGVEYRNSAGTREQLRASITIGADGRGSRMRHLAGFEPIQTAPPMDVLWLRLPRIGEQRDTNLAVFCGRGYYIAVTDRQTDWQLSYVIPKGTFGEIRARGLEAFRASITELIPGLGAAVNELRDWKEVSMLSVASSRVRRWYRPGLLLIGDAAHVMSSVGGFGINCAIQDAVVAANVLGVRLQKGAVTTADLARVQRKRSWSIRVIQLLQSIAQKQIIGRALDPRAEFRYPFMMRIPFVDGIATRMVAFGLGRTRVSADVRGSQPAAVTLKKQKKKAA
jgi:2-polyprenyl-6-methoxyphenol hydroxylase-like FAD-dependent oxidoreductase